MFQTIIKLRINTSFLLFVRIIIGLLAAEMVSHHEHIKNVSCSVKIKRKPLFRKIKISKSIITWQTSHDNV